MRVLKVPVWMAAALLLASMFALLPATGMAQADPFLGTWVLNVAKSKYLPGPPPKEQTVIYEAAGDGLKITVKATEADGEQTSFSFTGKFDGKDYPSTGNPDFDTQSFKRVNPNTLEMTRKTDGKVVQTGTNVVSADGKTRTITMKGVDDKGQKVEIIALYDKK